MDELLRDDLIGSIDKKIDVAEAGRLRAAEAQRGRDLLARVVEEQAERGDVHALLESYAWGIPVEDAPSDGSAFEKSAGPVSEKFKRRVREYLLEHGHEPGDAEEFLRAYVDGDREGMRRAVRRAAAQAAASNPLREEHDDETTRLFTAPQGFSPCEHGAPRGDGQGARRDQRDAS